MHDTDTFIRSDLFVRIQRKSERLDAHRPLPETAMRKLRDELRLLHTYHSNAIEGNTLSLQETKLVLAEGLTIGGKSIREHLEATNNAEAFDLIEAIAKEKREIDHITIQRIHEVVTRGIDADAGKYRVHNVRITGATKTPPDFSKVYLRIDDLIESLKDTEKREHPIKTATFLHHKLVEIHPFADGNGRVARLLTNLYLMKEGYPPIVLRKEERRKYYHVLHIADEGNLGPFANFIAKSVDESLTLYLAIFGDIDELVPLTDLAKLKECPYTQEYLSLRARQGFLDAVKIGRKWQSSRRALRDYIREHAKINLCK
ncbi:MAG: Fic family protein [Methanophagales archaeon]|nr:Fic family protein [Methanophagales archaeon]